MIHKDLDITQGLIKTRLMLLIIRQKNRLELMLKDHPDRTELIAETEQNIDSLVMANDFISEMREQLKQESEKKRNIWREYLLKVAELEKLKPDYTENLNPELDKIIIGKNTFQLIS